MQMDISLAAEALFCGLPAWTVGHLSQMDDDCLPKRLLVCAHCGLLLSSGWAEISLNDLVLKNQRRAL